MVNVAVPLAPLAEIVLPLPIPSLPAGVKLNVTVNVTVVPVAKFPYASSTNTVIAGLIVVFFAKVLGGCWPQTSLFAAAALTTTVKLPDPAELIEPSVAPIVAVCALYSTIVRVPVDTPLVNVIAVAVPKLVPFTVGLVTGLGDELAPEKVRLWLPV